MLQTLSFQQKMRCLHCCLQRFLAAVTPPQKNHANALPLCLKYFRKLCLSAGGLQVAVKQHGYGAYKVPALRCNAKSIWAYLHHALGLLLLQLLQLGGKVLLAVDLPGCFNAGVVELALTHDGHDGCAANLVVSVEA